MDQAGWWGVGSVATRCAHSTQVIMGRVKQSQIDASTEGHTVMKVRILGVDYGRARIGLAIADNESRMPQPLGTMERINRNEDMRRLRELIREHGVRQIVVGLPLRLDGSRGEMAEEVERFAQRLRKQIGVPVELMDERLTSWEAERLMEEIQGRFIRDEKLAGGKKSNNAQAEMTVDAVAAAVILKEYLDRQGQAAVKA